MNYQLFKKHELIDWLLSVAAKKSGLEIEEEQLFKVIKNDSLLAKIHKNKKEPVSLDEIEYEEFSRILLCSIGTISSSCDSVLVFNSLDKEYDSFDLNQEKILQQFISFLKDEISRNDQIISFVGFIESIIENNGMPYLPFAIDVVNSFVEHIIASPYSSQTKYSNVDAISLNDLFVSGKAGSQIGDFFDLRYIDYLYKNFDDLSKVHWRKFEELTVEYFEKQGYDVKLGPGTKDGGIDVTAKSNKELLLIQCKRWKNAIDVKTVKALHDDVSYKNASAGVLVSIKGISKDSKKIIKDRDYKILIIDGDALFEMLARYKSTF